MVFALPACATHDRIRFIAIDNREIHRSGITGATQIEARTGSRWEVEITLHPKERAAAQEWHGKLLRGMRTPFYITPPNTTQMLYQASDGVSPGSPLVKGADQTGTSLITDGWTEGFVIKTGDYIEVSAGGYSWLLMHEGDDVTASGPSGDATLTVFPPITTSPADNAVIRTSSPRCEMILRSPEQGLDIDRFGIYRQSFEAFQWIR